MTVLFCNAAQAATYYHKGRMPRKYSLTGKTGPAMFKLMTSAHTDLASLIMWPARVYAR